MNFRDFVNELDQKGLLKHIKKEVNAKYEVSTLMKHMADTPLLFENVKGYDMPVVANVCSTREVVAIGLGVPQDQILPTVAKALENPIEPAMKAAEGYQEVAPELGKLPILSYYPMDGGPYVASGIAFAYDEDYGLNASYHRAMKLDNQQFVLRILKRDLEAYAEKGLKEFAFCMGNSIPVLVGSAVSMARDVSEISIANALRETPLIEVEGHKVPESDIILIMEFTGEMHKEGPFLDLTETPDIIRDQRVARVKKMFVKDGAAFHGLLPGGLEHKTLMGMPREPTIFKEVSKVCKVKDVLITPGGCSWLHANVSIYKENDDDGRKAIEAAFAGHKSMKHVFVVDHDIDIHDPHQVEWAFATRFQGDKDMIERHEKGSSLDPSSDLSTQMTHRMGFDITIPAGRDPQEFKKPELPLQINPEDYI